MDEILNALPATSKELSERFPDPRLPFWLAQLVEENKIITTKLEPVTWDKRNNTIQS